MSTRRRTRRRKRKRRQERLRETRNKKERTRREEGRRERKRNQPLSSQDVFFHFRSRYILQQRSLLHLSSSSSSASSSSSSSSFFYDPSCTHRKKGNGTGHQDGKLDFVFDFIADTGDGGNSTYSVARALAQPFLRVKLP